MVRKILTGLAFSIIAGVGLAVAPVATPPAATPQAAAAYCAATGRSTAPRLYVPSYSHTSVTVHIVGVGDRVIGRGGLLTGCPDKFKVALFDDMYVDFSNNYTVTACADGWHTFGDWGRRNGGSSSITFTGEDRIAACH